MNKKPNAAKKTAKKKSSPNKLRAAEKSQLKKVVNKKVIKKASPKKEVSKKMKSLAGNINLMFKPVCFDGHGILGECMSETEALKIANDHILNTGHEATAESC